MKKLVFFLLFIPVMLCAQEPMQPVNNVIFLVGDGMGTAQVYSSIARMGDKSNFLRFPYSGFSRTYSNNKYTTDSGAGGSALMTGHKVDNYHIAKADSGEEFPSFFVSAQKEGMATGFVVSCSVLDATPAATYAHVSDRKSFDSISLQMSRCGHDVMIGGDKNHFLPENRKDGTSPLDTLKARGYELVFSSEEMQKAKGSKLCALLSGDNPATQPARGEMLSEGVNKALDILALHEGGFALMIEGSQIDWACHNNDSAYLRLEMEDFEKVLQIVLDYAEADGNTLVVVTADHETGGLSLLDGDIEKGVSQMTFATGNHSGCMVPVFSFGPGADWFSGVQQNTDIPKKIAALLGIKF